MKNLLGGFVFLSICVLPLAAQERSSPPVDTGYVEYHDSPLTLPLGIGFRVPEYDRVNGLSLPWGPRLELGEWLRADALATYRSHLGNFDPSLDVRLTAKDGHQASLFAARGTFTNDDWIRSDIANSLASFGVGSDARNYYRADRLEAKLRPMLRMGAFAVTPSVGGRFENDWGTGSLTPTRTPWSILGRTDSLKMKRHNQPITKGHISSALVGLGFAVDETSIAGKVGVTVEHAFKAPVGRICTVVYTAPVLCTKRSASSFTQTTLDANVTFPTFGAQSFTARAHVLIPSGGLLPQQRYGYLGGAGTLATVNLLSLGGDRLFYAQGDYYAPVSIITLPFLGSPYVDLRYAAGNAGVGLTPSLIQNIGIGVGISYIRADYTIDPARNRFPGSRRSEFSVGISLGK